MTKSLTSKNAGFTVIEALLIFVIIAGVGGSAYYVWRQQHKAKPIAVATTTSVKATTTPKVSTQPVTLSQTYTSPQYGFSFKYPAGWKLTSDLTDNGRGGPEGDIYVQSPDGTRVHFGPNFGGKGGDCWDDQAQARTTRTCTTRDILSVTSLPNVGPQPIWLIHASDTAPTEQGGKTTYFIYLSSDEYGSDGELDVTPTTGSTLGAFLGTYDDVLLNKDKSTVYLTVSVDGNDDSQNGTSAFFNSKEVTEATPVLESLKEN